jgi:hypothetical protein
MTLSTKTTTTEPRTKGDAKMQKLLIATAIVAAVSPATAAPISRKDFDVLYRAMVQVANQNDYPAHVYCYPSGCERQQTMPFGYFDGKPGYLLIDDILDDDKVTVLGSMICRFAADSKVRTCRSSWRDTAWAERRNEATNTWEYTATIDP